MLITYMVANRIQVVAYLERNMYKSKLHMAPTVETSLHPQTRAGLAFLPREGITLGLTLHQNQWF